METYFKIVVAMALFSFHSCGKRFLDVKSDVSIGTPHEVSDYQALLDNSTAVMNSNASHVLGIIGGDEFYLADPVWHALSNLAHKNAYIWADRVYEGTSVADWDDGYKRILYANMVLDGLANISPATDEQEAWSRAYGSALFFRAMNFFQLAQLFCKEYDRHTSEIDLGIPLRLEADVTIKSKRATVAETYSRIVHDLEYAVTLLPDEASVKMRPSKAAAYALLARVYLQMEDYQRAHQYADNALSLQSDLVDFNDLHTATQYFFSRDYGETNPEVIFYCYSSAPVILTSSRMQLSPELLELYSPNDRRLEVYYTVSANGNRFFRGSFTGSVSFFVGLSTSEMLLIRAECQARRGADEMALSDLNRLGRFRYDTGTFVPHGPLNNEQIMKVILDERRRELAFRGLRWSDLRRLNKETRFAKVIRREIDGQIYQLDPNSPKYVWPIPENVISLSGIEQNER